MRLWIRLALVMALLCTLPALVTALVAVNISTERTTDYAKELVAREAQSHADFVGRWVTDQTEAVGAWTRLYRLGPLDDSKREGLLRSVFKAVPSVVDVVLVDLDAQLVADPVFLDREVPPESDLHGRVVSNAARARELVRRLPVSQAMEIARARRAEGLPATGAAVGLPYRVDGDPVPVVPVAVIGDGDDVVLGAEVTLAPLLELERGSSADHAVVVLDAEGRVVVGGAHPLVEPERLAPFIDNPVDATIDEQVLSTGQTVVGATAAIPALQWTVVVVEPMAKAQSAADRIRSTTALVLGVSVVFALLVGVRVAQSESGSVSEVKDAALEVAEGRFGKQAHIRGSQEVQDLARAFNHMSARLERNRDEIAAQQAEIEAFNLELQDRVEARTRQLQAAQAQLVQSGQLAAVAEVGAGMAHELNNPLTAILGSTQLLRMRAQLSEADEALVRDLEAEAERCREVVSAMVRFSSGEVDPANAPVLDLRAVLSDVLDLVQGPFRQRGVELRLVEGSAPLRVRLDPVLASRMFAAILNSLRMGLPEGAVLEVEPRAEGDQLVVHLVPSTAVGLETRDDYMAGGMGLWVARRLLDQIGGRLVPSKDGPWQVVLPAHV